MPRVYERTSPADRFEAKVQRSDGCWEWKGYRARRRGQETGYGKFGLKREQMVLAHRFAYELWVGPIPEGLCVLHRCDNPACVRPDHLFLGTNQDNYDDMIAKGRWRPGDRKDHCRQGHDFTAENTMYAPDGSRRCRVCHDAWEARRAKAPVTVGSRWQSRDKRDSGLIVTVIEVTDGWVRLDRERSRRVTRLRFPERYRQVPA